MGRLLTSQAFILAGLVMAGLKPQRIELPVMKYDSVLERRKSPPRTRRTSRRERRIGSSSGSKTKALDLEVEEELDCSSSALEGGWRSLGGKVLRERKVVIVCEFYV